MHSHTETDLDSLFAKDNRHAHGDNRAAAVVIGAFAVAIAINLAKYSVLQSLIMGL